MWHSLRLVPEMTRHVHPKIPNMILWLWPKQRTKPIVPPPHFLCAKSFLVNMLPLLMDLNVFLLARLELVPFNLSRNRVSFSKKLLLAYSVHFRGRYLPRGRVASIAPSKIYSYNISLCMHLPELSGILLKSLQNAACAGPRLWFGGATCVQTRRVSVRDSKERD